VAETPLFHIGQKTMPAQPLDIYRAPVQAEWIDDNGHMNVAYYVLMFDRATDALLDRLGLGAAYRQRTNHSIYVLEAHVTYEREVKEGDMLRVASQLVDADAKRLHFFHTMYHAGVGYRAATTELLALHVDLAGPTSLKFAATEQAAVDAMLDEHRTLARPPQLGRVIGIRPAAPRPQSPLSAGEG
jgi:acyl-CoA thioester hydrolase